MRDAFVIWCFINTTEPKQEKFYSLSTSKRVSEAGSELPSQRLSKLNQ